MSLHLSVVIRPCALGLTLVARDREGLCAIFLGNEAAALELDLRRRFPGALLAPPDAAFDADSAQVLRFLDAPERGLALPLALHGTEFQQRVWRALQTIPAGETLTYTGLAQRIGSPRSVRAVAGACGANPLAVVIPCHRVIRSDGGLSGYRWGTERKRALLQREGALAALGQPLA